MNLHTNLKKYYTNIKQKLPIGESTANKNTKRITKIGFTLYGLHALFLIIAVPLVIPELSTLTNQLFTFGVFVFIFHYSISYPTQGITKIYKNGFIRPRPFAKRFLSATTLGIVAPPFLLLTLYNAGLALYLYKYQTK